MVTLALECASTYRLVAADALVASHTPLESHHVLFIRFCTVWFVVHCEVNTQFDILHDNVLGSYAIVPALPLAIF